MLRIPTVTVTVTITVLIIILIFVVIIRAVPFHTAFTAALVATFFKPADYK